MNLNEYTKQYIRIEKIMNESIKQFDITYHQWLVMREIYFAENTMLNASDISDNLCQDKRLTSLTSKKLEEKYLLLRIENEEDKRHKYITLTDNALSICQEILEIETAIEFEYNS